MRMVPVARQVGQAHSRRRLPGRFDRSAGWPQLGQPTWSTSGWGSRTATRIPASLPTPEPIEAGATPGDGTAARPSQPGRGRCRRRRRGYSRKPCSSIGTAPSTSSTPNGTGYGTGGCAHRSLHRSRPRIMRRATTRAYPLPTGSPNPVRWRAVGHKDRPARMAVLLQHSCAPRLGPAGSWCFSARLGCPTGGAVRVVASRAAPRPWRWPAALRPMTWREVPAPAGRALFAGRSARSGRRPGSSNRLAG